MKKMTCKQLGGACDIVFEANSFDEMAELSRAHGMEMFSKQDPAHLAIMAEMKSLMETPGAMQQWMDDKKKLFESLPDEA